MRRILVSLLLALVAVTTVTAQNATRSKWSNQMLEAKHQFIMQKVGLTPTQKEKFMPLYAAMESEIYDVNRQARATAAAVAKKSHVKDSEYKAAADALSNAKVQEGEIEAKYYAQFGKILSPKQLFLLKQAELDFNKQMIRGSSRHRQK